MENQSMVFPKTFEEFAKLYGFVDEEEVYTNGSELIPVFRVQQWLDHIKEQTDERHRHIRNERCNKRRTRKRTKIY